MTAFSNDDREAAIKIEPLAPSSSISDPVAQEAAPPGKEHILAPLRMDPLLGPIIQKFPLPVAWKNCEHRYLGANEQFARLLGLRSAQTLLGKSDRDLPWSDEARLAITRLAEEVLALDSPRKAVVTFEGNPNTPDKVFRVEAMPIRIHADGRDELCGCSCVFVDISNEVAAEQARRASETKIRAMLDRVPVVVVWTIDHDLRVTPQVSPGLSVLTNGNCHGETVSLPAFFGTSDPNFPPVLGARRALAGESVRFTMPWHGCDYEVFIEPVRNADGEIAGALGITIDITDQRRQAEALRISEERYRSLAEYCPLGIWQTDLDGKSIYMNPAMCELLQLHSPGEAVTESFRSFFSPASRNRLNSRLTDVGRLTRFEAEIVGKQGRSRSVLVTSVPVFGPDQRIAGQLHTYLDITEQKRTEEARQRVEARVRHGQKIESLGLLAEGIAHDFNNLLLGVLGNAGLAALEVAPNSRAAFRLEQVKRVAEHAAELTNQLFLYSGRQEAHRQIIHLSSEVEEMCRLLETAMEKKIRLKFELAINLPPIEANSAQVRQVVMNLVSNAREALRDNGGQITIRTGVMNKLPSDLQEDFARTYSDSGPQPESYVFLEVQDSGCGMDLSTKQRMFDPFFSTKQHGFQSETDLPIGDNVGARGLGLATVLGTVRSHHGAIAVQSVPQRGTSLRLFFPTRPGLVAPHRAPMSGFTKLPSRNGHGVVLVVDDDPIVQEVAQVALEKFGYHVVVAKDGRQALLELDDLRNLDVLKRKGLPSEGVIAVLLDLTMPVLDGEAVLKQLEVKYPQLPVILSSGYSKEGVADRIRHTGKLKFLQKPYRPTVLIETLQGMVLTL